MEEIRLPSYYRSNFIEELEHIVNHSLVTIVTIPVDYTILQYTEKNILNISELIENSSIIFEYNIVNNFSFLLKKIYITDFLLRVLIKNNLIYDVTPSFFVKNFSKYHCYFSEHSYIPIINKIYELAPHLFNFVDVSDEDIYSLMYFIVKDDSLYLWWKSKDLRVVYDSQLLLDINPNTTILKEILIDMMNSSMDMSTIILCPALDVSKYDGNTSIFTNSNHLFQLLTFFEEYGIEHTFDDVEIKLLFIALYDAHLKRDNVAFNKFAYYIDMNLTADMLPLIFSRLDLYDLNIPYIQNYFFRMKTIIELFIDDSYIDLKTFVKNINIIRDYIPSGDIYFSEDIEYTVWFYSKAYSPEDLRIFYNFCKEIDCSMTELEDFDERRWKDIIDEIYESYSDIYGDVFMDELL